MEESYSKLDSTQKIVIKLFQQLVTEHTDRIHSLVQCTPPPGYRVYRPAAGITALNVQCFSWLQSPYLVPFSHSDFQHNIVVKSLQQLGTECTNQVPAIQPLYCLPAPQLVTESSDPVHSTLLSLGQVDSEYLRDMVSTD